MKREKKDLLKVQTLLENDRLNTGEDFIALVKNDTKKILSDYFEFNEQPTIKLEKTGDRLKVEISVYACRIKTFDILPKL